MGYKLNGKPLELDVAFTDSDGAQYPSTWLRNSNATLRAAVKTGGITWEDDPPWYDQRFYRAKNSPLPIADLKADYIQRQKISARSLLNESDWQVIREKEGGTAVSSDMKTYRAAVRTQCKAREDQITACSNTDALATLIQASLYLKGTADNGATEKKKDDGSSYDPKQWNDDAPNSAALKAWPDLPS